MRTCCRGADCRSIESFADSLSQAPIASEDAPTTEELETCIGHLRSNARIRAGLASLYSQRLGCFCSADQEVHSALIEQVEALTWEREALKTELQRGYTDADEARLYEVERTLREAKAELEAARIRIGELDGWRDPMSHEKGFSVQVLMKIGKSAL